MRLYPEKWPIIKNEATTENFGIVEIIGKGEGLRTKKNFSKGELVFSFSGFLIPWRTLYTLEVSPILHIEDPYVMGKVIHSCDPNMLCDMQKLSFIATRDIESGEILTMDYETTESILFRRFTCNCGSENCRKIIAGYLEVGKSRPLYSVVE